MKLCMVNGYFHPFVGGSERHMYELGKRMARTEEISVVTSRLDGTEPYEEIENMRVHRLETRHYKMPLIYPPPMPVTKGVMDKLEELDREHDFDAFNLHGRWFGSYNRVVDYAAKKNKLFVLTLHNARPFGISPSVSLFGAVYESLRGKHVIKSADRLISVSEALKRDIMEYGIDGDKISVIYNGVDTGFYKPSGKSFQDKYKDGFDHLLVFVGRIIQQKGLNDLIDAMPAVLKEHPKTRILLVGKGKQEGQLRDKIKQMGLEKHMVFTGFIPDGQMPELYSSADVFVLPSLWETFGFVLAEAASCGVPLCASNAGGIPEVVEDGGNGLIFEKGNPKDIAAKLNTMLDDPDALTQMGRRSRELAVQKFDWEIIKEQTLAFYKEAIGSFYPGGPGC